MEVPPRRPTFLFSITVGSSLRPGRASWAAACADLPAALRWRRFSVSASACAELMLEVLLALLSVLPVRYVLSASHLITLSQYDMSRELHSRLVQCASLGSTSQL